MMTMEGDAARGWSMMMVMMAMMSMNVDDKDDDHDDGADEDQDDDVNGDDGNVSQLKAIDDDGHDSNDRWLI